MKQVKSGGAGGAAKDGAVDPGDAGTTTPGEQPTPPDPSTAAAAEPDAPASALGIKIAPVTFAWCLHAYLLTRAAARKLVKNMPVSAPADIFVASLMSATDGRPPTLTARAVLPVLATSGGVGAPPGDVSSSGTRRAGAVDGINVWASEGEAKAQEAVTAAAALDDGGSKGNSLTVDLLD